MCGEAKNEHTQIHLNVYELIGSSKQGFVNTRAWLVGWLVGWLDANNAIEYIACLAGGSA